MRNVTVEMCSIGEILLKSWLIMVTIYFHKFSKVRVTAANKIALHLHYHKQMVSGVTFYS